MGQQSQEHTRARENCQPFASADRYILTVGRLRHRHHPRCRRRSQTLFMCVCVCSFNYLHIMVDSWKAIKYNMQASESYWMCVRRILVQRIKKKIGRNKAVARQFRNHVGELLTHTHTQN